MPEPATDGREEFLQRIADGLPFDEVEKLDILRELAAHLADSTARFESEGLTLDEAQRTALDRLGPPDRLAAELTRARRTPRRLLAAAGAGTWAAASGVIYGYIFGVLILVVVSIGTVALAASAVHLFGGSWGSLLNTTVITLNTTVITLLALGVGFYVAGLKVTPVVAARAGYHLGAARRVTAALGGVLIAGYALLGWSGILNWPDVAILLSLPAWFVVGAWRATAAAFPSPRWHLQILSLMLVVVPLCLVLGAGQQPQSSGSGGLRPTGVERIGLPTPAAVAAAQGIESGGGKVGGVESIGTAIRDPAVLAGWRDLRVEAWRGTGAVGIDPSLMALDPAARGPFAVGPAGFEAPGQIPPWTWSSGDALPDGSVRLSGSVRIDRSPSATLAWVAITGVGPDGHRYIISGPSYDSTAFNGTAWDWFAAIVEGR
jgi:hypothetical protein